VSPPIPVPDADSSRYWAATLEGRLELQRCDACRRLVFYPRARCPRCYGDRLTWTTLAGTGTVHAFTVVHRPADPSLADAVPYVVALVELTEGARLMTNIVGCDPSDVHVGMPVAVSFRPVSDAASLPVFSPVPAVVADA
jgi:hypothetical protein